MKITHNKVGQNINLVDGGRAGKSEKINGKKPEGKDLSSLGGLDAFNPSVDATKVDVSPRAQEAKRIKELAMAAPDVDQEKVEKFRRMIDDGKYKVDSKAVADKMVDAYLSEEQ